MFSREIVNNINVQIKVALDLNPVYQQGKYYSICRLVPRETENGQKLIAALVATDGEGSPTEGLIDDTFPLCIYHRCLGYSFSSESDNQRNSFGRKFMLKSTANMIMVVFGDGKRLGVHQERLLSNVVASMPVQLNKNFIESITGLQAVTIVPTSENNDSVQVYKNEGEQKYFLGTNMLLFSLSYQIFTEFDKSCYDICYC